MAECKYCGSSWRPEKDHIMAKSKGGRKTEKVCRTCNRSKGNKALIDWFRWLKQNNPYRWRKIRKYNYRKKNTIAQKVHKVRDEKEAIFY